MKPTIYVPHLPTRLDPVTRSTVPTINLQPAARIGELQIINNKGGDALPDNFAFSAARISKALQSMTEEDYILICGDPVLCAVAIHVAIGVVGSAKVLRWNRDARNYDLITTPPRGDSQ